MRIRVQASVRMVGLAAAAKMIVGQGASGEIAVAVTVDAVAIWWILRARRRPGRRGIADLEGRGCSC